MISRVPSIFLKNPGYRIVVDGVESGEIGPSPIGPLMFDGPDRLHVLAGGKRLELELSRE